MTLAPDSRTQSIEIPDAIETRHIPLVGDDSDYDALIDRIGDARIVLLGEASHGTYEFYRERARITRRLIQGGGFDAVCIEGDWPDAWRVNRYVRCMGHDPNALSALAGFERFPRWMWRNDVVVDFVEWMRTYNCGKEPLSRVGFYGVDLYSMFASIDEVIETLSRIDKQAGEQARDRYSCFSEAKREAQAYGFYAAHDILESCEEPSLRQVEVVTRMLDEATDVATQEALFNAQQNAQLVVDAERYYRIMYEGTESSWNLRDEHMVDTIETIMQHVEQQTGRPGRVIVWEHNSHLGDARATERSLHGERNVGQMVRERWPGKTYSLGFSTFTGSVTAAHDWGEEPRLMRVRPALEDSYERLLHESGLGDFMLLLDSDQELQQMLEGPLLQRAIGVIYRPETERHSHYFSVSLPHQFDALIHIDESSALAPLDMQVSWDGAEPPETYPSGL